MTSTYPYTTLCLVHLGYGIAQGGSNDTTRLVCHFGSYLVASGQVEELASWFPRRTWAVSFVSPLCCFLYSMHSIFFFPRRGLHFLIFCLASGTCHACPSLIFSFSLAPAGTFTCCASAAVLFYFVFTYFVARMGVLSSMGSLGSIGHVCGLRPLWAFCLARGDTSSSRAF